MVHHRHRYINRDNGKETCIEVSMSFLTSMDLRTVRLNGLKTTLVNSKKELARREGYYIQNNMCVNKNVAGRTSVESREATREKTNKRLERVIQEKC